MKEPSGFQRIIKSLPKTFVVLDVGAGGLEGKNTSQFILEHFDPKNYLGVCREKKQVDLYHAQRAERKESRVNIIVDDFYSHDFSDHGLFDLVVLDLNIESNIQQDWTEQGLKNMLKLVKPGGYLINYIMTTDQYGNPDETPALIRNCWKEFYGTNDMTPVVIGKRLKQLEDYELFAYEQEERRPYIMWICLKRR